MSPPSIGFGIADIDQVLDADAEAAGPIVAGLVGQDHAGQQFLRRQAGDALRPLMHREIGADAMAGAVGVVGAGLPERDARQRIEIAAARALRETRRADGDHALQNQREEPLLLLRHRADRNRAGDIGRAVDILRAGIDQEQLAGLQQPVASPSSPGNA